MIIKICGLRREEDVSAAVSAGADICGFILSPRFKRYMDPKVLGNIKVPEGVLKAGVFVDESIPYVISAVGDGGVDLIQLHGEEDEDYIRELKEALPGKRVIKVFKVKGHEDIGKANRSSADLILLDSGVGGTGRVFDHSLLSEIERDYILAGGLNEDNVSGAVSNGGPHLMGVDVSSGVETEGVKDPGKMKRFVINARKRSS